MANDVSAETIALLEARLQRVTFFLTGDETSKIVPTAEGPTAAARLRTIERHLQTLCTRCEAAREVLELHAKSPDIFHPSRSAPPNPTNPTTLATIVLSHSDSYKVLASQLETCKSRAVPEPSALVPLVDLQARIAKVAARQDQQQIQLADLRSRSARTLETWYTNGVLEMSECWADWEERLRDVEILVRRMEAAKRREEGFV